MTTYFVETADIPFKIDWDNPVESRLLRLVPSDYGATAAERPLTKSKLNRFGERFDTEGNLAGAYGDILIHEVSQGIYRTRPLGLLR